MHSEQRCTVQPADMDTVITHRIRDLLKALAVDVTPPQDLPQARILHGSDDGLDLLAQIRKTVELGRSLAAGIHILCDCRIQLNALTLMISQAVTLVAQLRKVRGQLIRSAERSSVLPQICLDLIRPHFIAPILSLCGCASM